MIVEYGVITLSSRSSPKPPCPFTPVTPMTSSVMDFTRTLLPTGRLRGNSHGIGAFLIETFIDELAQATRHEPLSYRMALLGAQPRLAACLQRAAMNAGSGSIN